MTKLIKPVFVCTALTTLAACSSTSLLDPASDPMVQPYPGTDVAGYQLAWSDEFNGTEVDENRWKYRLDCKHWSKQQKQNNSVSDGLLRIHLKKETVSCPENKALQPGQQEGEKPAGEVQYTGGGVISNDEMRYGYYEARLKTPTGAGWHSSFWMMRHGIYAGDPAYSQIELDPFENDSIDPKHYQIDAHQWRPEPGTEDPGRTQNKVGTKQVRFSDDTRLDEFHVYGMEFTETTIRYFFDGKLMKETAFPEKQYKHNDVSIWLTSIGTFLGNTKAIDDSRLPEQMQVDYVRFFKKQ
ncbi:glycoside hydrolase family 16 protein [Thalassotalea mangrovi]|uniref:Glycoside hydrolase family 16 protein n=1 Tax=Thalassotalea mangrovi TaxID=2572245 RepID=A0A4U1B1M9_9GAMM|nr:glycoside hydrolase family 16 protein [Thalassotalea mangrovi]TKB43064.1 glycoside hydrolase family 16 protein [Thalassotalea mangrovi]